LRRGVRRYYGGKGSAVRKLSVEDGKRRPWLVRSRRRRKVKTSQTRKDLGLDGGLSRDREGREGGGRQLTIYQEERGKVTRQKEGKKREDEIVVWPRTERAGALLLRVKRRKKDTKSASSAKRLKNW